MIGFVKCFDNNKTMSFKITDNNLLEKYTEIWRRVNNLMNIEFDSEPVYGDVDKYLKTKIKMYEGRVNTNFQGKKVLNENVSYDCLSLITLDSVVRVNKKYYSQTLLKECRYKIRKNKREHFISADLEIDIDSESYNEFESESECSSIESD